MKKTFALYELSGGRPAYFYNDSKRKFVPNAKDATLWTRTEAEKVRTKLHKERVATGKRHAELHTGDLYKKGILEMKLTKSELRQIIREELKRLTESADKSTHTVFFISVSGDQSEGEGWTSYGKNDTDAVKNLRDYLKNELRYKKNQLSWTRSQVKKATGKDATLAPFTQIQ